MYSFNKLNQIYEQRKIEKEQEFCDTVKFISETIDSGIGSLLAQDNFVLKKCQDDPDSPEYFKFSMKLNRYHITPKNYNITPEHFNTYQSQCEKADPGFKLCYEYDPRNKMYNISVMFFDQTKYKDLDF